MFLSFEFFASALQPYVIRAFIVREKEFSHILCKVMTTGKGFDFSVKKSESCSLGHAR